MHALEKNKVLLLYLFLDSGYLYEPIQISAWFLLNYLFVLSRFYESVTK